MKRKREGFCASFPKNVMEFLAEQRGDKRPDFGEIKSHQNARNGSEQFRSAVNFHRITSFSLAFSLWAPDSFLQWVLQEPWRRAF